MQDRKYGWVYSGDTDYSQRHDSLLPLCFVRTQVVVRGVEGKVGGARDTMEDGGYFLYFMDFHEREL